MPLSASDLAQKHRIVPVQTTVTLTPKNPPSDAITLYMARKRPATAASEFEQLGVTVTTAHALWVLPSEELSSYEPKPGDLITDSDSVDWLIEDVHPFLAQAEWKALCKRQRTNRT